MRCARSLRAVRRRVVVCAPPNNTADSAVAPFWVRIRRQRSWSSASASDDGCRTDDGTPVRNGLGKPGGSQVCRALRPAHIPRRDLASVVLLPHEVWVPISVEVRGYYDL